MSSTRIPFVDGIGAQERALARVEQAVDDALDRLDPVLLAARRPTFLAMGASYAALAATVTDLRRDGVAAVRELASESTGAPGADLVVAVSQGGRSAETLAALDGLDVPTVGLVNVVGSPLEERTDAVVGLGGELDSYASTVGLTATLVALERLGARLVGGRPSPWGGVGEHVASVVAAATDVLGPFAARCVAGAVSSADVVAAGRSVTTAEATALLLREVVRLPTTAAVTRNYLHGAMESAGATLHVVVGDGREVPLARTLAGAGHLTLLVTTQDVAAEGALEVVRLPGTTPAQRTVLEVVALQVLARELAAAADVDIEAFVFANHDTKAGGVDPGDFAVASPDLGA